MLQSGDTEILAFATGPVFDGFVPVASRIRVLFAGVTALLMDTFRSAMPQKISSADLKFRAFSDRTRLRILRLLQNGELCVGNLVAVIKVPQPTASRHLAYLRRAGLVSVRKSGQWMFYSLAPARDGFHRSLMACLRHCFQEVAEVKADQKRAVRLRRQGGCCP